MQAALEAGAKIINDVSALGYDPDSAAVVAQAQVRLSFSCMRRANPRPCS